MKISNGKDSFTVTELSGVISLDQKGLELQRHMSKQALHIGMQACEVWEHAKVTWMCIYNIPLRSDMPGLINDLHA